MLSNSLSNQMGTMKSYYEKELKSLSYMYDNELHKLSRSIEYKENEIQHLRSIIDVVKNNNLERKQGYPSSAHSRDESEATTDPNSEYDNDSKGEAYNGERDGLRFQDEALLVYEGGVWEDDEHSEMGHDGDDY